MGSATLARSLVDLNENAQKIGRAILPPSGICEKISCSGFSPAFFECLDSVAQMGDRYGATYNEADVEGFEELFIRHLRLYTLDDMVGDAVIAA